ncbi:MAG TPA: hypothetical protein PKE55_09290 [Kiritimatiellia bacterium]|nr:hypothetical protein [Kiritimatiellia bacterium]
MAWRVSRSLVKGVLDNRVKHVITGKLWLLGRDEPVEIDLEGNFLRDLAGCEILFVNPEPKEGDAIDLDANQAGVAGDMTASRRVNILSPVDPETTAKDKLPVRKRANALYLEWFSDTDGRVVIESTEFPVAVSEPAWLMTDEEAKEQAEANLDHFRAWLEHLSEFENDTPSPGDFDAPLNEFQWEQLLRESDRKTERLGEVLEKYHGHPDSERLIAREMGWTWLEEEIEAQERGLYAEDDEDLEDFDFDDDDEDDELIDIDPDPMKEGIDWVRDEHGEVHHPLALKTMRFAMKMWNTFDQLGLLGQAQETIIHSMVMEVQVCSSKLAGALNGLAYDDEVDNGYMVAALKRAVNHIHSALSLVHQIGQQKVVKPEVIRECVVELFRVREEITDLMGHYRARFKQG